MKVLLRAILYKAVTPPYCIVDMESDVWREFLFAKNTRRKEMAIQLVNRPGWSDTSIKEIVWVPLDSQNMIKDIAGLLD